VSCSAKSSVVTRSRGAVIGAAAGTAVAVATKGNPIVLPAGARLRVELTEPVTVTARPSERSDRPGAEEQR
jgi:uncharacterized protein YjlB